MNRRPFWILSLMLIFCCHQSHHHIFLFVTNPLTLASEEFIPLNEPATSAETETGSPLADKDVGDKVDIQGSQHVQPETVPKLDKDTPLNSGESQKENVILDTSSSPSSPSEEFKESIPNNDEGVKPQNTIPDFPPEEKINSQAPSNSNLKIPVGVDVNVLDKAENDLNNLSSESEEAAGNNPGDVTDNSNTIANAEGAESNRTRDNTLENEAVFSSPKIEVPTIPTTPTPAPHKEEEPIPSFMEWTQLQQQKLHESNLAQQAGTASAQANSQNGYKSQHAAHSQLNKSSLAGNQAEVEKSRKESNAKNFASPDCGAKVIQSNPESQNANGVLSSSHDEYMLNKCGIPIWFIVELCEPLKIEKVSLGNLELFSSSPKDLEILISDRYPTREWSKLGPFSLPDIRAIHSINLPATNASTFGKFLRVNVLSHYGTEHFCPLSLVRVNGISEYEVLESENTHQEDMDAAEKEESALYEELVIDQHQHSTEGKAADKSVFGSAKDVVINIVKKAAEVLVKSDKRKDSSNVGDAAVDSNCRSLLQCLPNYEAQFHERVFAYLSCNFSNLLPFLKENSPWCGWDYCHALFSRHSIGLPWQPEGFYASLFGGPSVLHALCNYHKPLMKDSCDSMFAKNDTTTSGSESSRKVIGEGYANESVRSVPPITSNLNEDKDDVTTGKVEETKSEQETKEKVAVPSIQDTSENGKPKTPPVETEPPTEDQPSSPPLANGEAQQSQGTQQQGTTPSEDTSSATNQQQQTPPSSVQQQQQKESVFVRLSNRIKTLERNQSITASYLEELSRRFKKQNEENHHFNEGTKTFINDSKLKFKVLEDAYKFELRSLRRNTEEIRERLFNVQLQRSLLILLCLGQFVAIISFCFWIRRKFRLVDSQLQNITEQQPQSQPRPVARVPYSTTTRTAPVTSPSSISSSRQDTPQHPSPSVLALRKRVNSDGSLGSSLNTIDKSKKIKKKKKKLPELKPVTMKVSGPASAPIEYNTTTTMADESRFKFKYPETVNPTAVPPTQSQYQMPIPLSTFKENVNPSPTDLVEYNDNKSSSLPCTPPTGSIPPPPVTPNGIGGVNLLSTKVDSPFSMISSTSTNIFVDHTTAVSTSSRFALLASPGPGAQTKSSSLKRSGSLTSLDSSSTSSYSYGVKTGSNNVININNMNGHGDSQSQSSTASGGKKRKNKGLKAFMPKIFDR